MKPAEDPAQAIRAILARCESQQDARLALRALRNRCPELLTSVCLQWLEQRSLGEREEAIRVWLIARGEYVTPLMDPGILSRAGALRVGEILCWRDPDLSSRIFSYYRNARLDRTQLIRLLDIVDYLGLVDRLVPLIRELSNHSDLHVRAKAAGVYCRARPNPGNIQRQMTSENSRVRASAVEALWHTRTDFALDILRQAAHDPNPRVAANAMLGLYYAQEPDLLPKLKAMLERASPELTRSLTWAMGRMPNLGVADLLTQWPVSPPAALPPSAGEKPAAPGEDRRGLEAPKFRLL